MPRNPNKTYCTMSGCRNWAMRGQERCRWHATGLPSTSLTEEPSEEKEGPRGPGATSFEGAKRSGEDNLDALKPGASAHPLPPVGFQPIVAAVLGERDDLALQLGLRSAAEIPSCEGRRPRHPRQHRRWLSSEHSGDPRNEVETPNLKGPKRRGHPPHPAPSPRPAHPRSEAETLGTRWRSRALCGTSPPRDKRSATAASPTSSDGLPVSTRKPSSCSSEK